MRFAQDAAFVQSELFARVQLPVARVTPKTRQMIHVVPGFSYPVRSRYAFRTLRTHRTETPEKREKKHTHNHIARFEHFDIGIDQDIVTWNDFKRPRSNSVTLEFFKSRDFFSP